VNEQKGRQNPKELLRYSALTLHPEDELHLLKAERLTRLCGAGAPFWPLFLTPFRLSLFWGRKDFPITTGAIGPFRTNEV